MKRKGLQWLFFSVLMATFVCLLSLNARADVPDFIGYQGYLTDEEGNPVSGYLNVKFSIYDSEDGLDSLWEEGQTVLASDGLISTTLGAETPLTPDVFTAGSAYLEVEIDGDVLLPRLPIGSVPYCFYADNVPTSSEVMNWIVEGGYLTSSESDGRYYQQSEVDTLIGAKQDRVTGTCGLGSSIREVNVDGSVVCETDDDTTYTAGTGLTLDDTEFGLETSYMDGSVYDARFVNVEGDTMTGGLNLPADGFLVGTDQLVCSEGNVGIGTTNPEGKLHVESNFAGSSPIAKFKDGGVEGWDQPINLRRTDTTRYQWDVSSSLDFYVDFTNTGTGELGLTVDGNVGIGTTTPDVKLDVAGPTSIGSPFLMTPKIWNTPGYNKIEMKFLDYTIPDGNTPTIIENGAWSNFLFAVLAVVTETPTNSRYTYTGAWTKTTMSNYASFYSPAGTPLGNFSFRQSTSGAAYFHNTSGSSVRIVGIIYYD